MKLENFSNYEIYQEEGKIWSYKSNRFVGYQNPKGYWQVGLTDDEGVQHHFYLHRVIWEAVNGAIPENMQINHLTEDKNMNGIQFLELVTPKDNINYGTAIQRSAEKRRGRPNPKVGERLRGLLTNRKDLSKPVERCDLQGNVLERFASANEAQRQGYNKGSISQCCNGIFKQHKGFIWRYAI